MQKPTLRMSGAMMTTIRLDFYVGIEEITAAVFEQLYLAAGVDPNDLYSVNREALDQVKLTRSEIEDRVRTALKSGGYGYFYRVWESCSDASKDEIREYCKARAEQLFPGFKEGR